MLNEWHPTVVFDAFETEIIQMIIRGDVREARASLLTWLDSGDLDVPPEERALTARLLWTPEIWNLEDVDIRPGLVLRVLEETAASNPAGWTELESLDGFDRVERALEDSSLELLIAEQLAYAPPDSSWRTLGIARLEQLGSFQSGRAREAERLLHDLGQTSAAYRVEATRKRLHPKPTVVQRVPREPLPDSLAGRRIVIAGGHPALRSAVARQVHDRHGDLREIPSKFEAVRRDRQVSQLVMGSDLAIIITRQIAHSTSDQVKRAANRYEVPVRHALSPSMAGILAVVDRFDES